MSVALAMQGAQMAADSAVTMTSTSSSVLPQKEQVTSGFDCAPDKAARGFDQSEAGFGQAARRPQGKLFARRRSAFAFNFLEGCRMWRADCGFGGGSHCPRSLSE
jgi:hypothetical protein